MIGLLMVPMLYPGIVQYLASSQELLVLFAIAWAVALASTQYRNVISGRLVGIRDFLLLFSSYTSTSSLLADR
ncbi:hypothetical protein [Pontibacter kalidii]|uniref:hypothetical protein n=1 Tax=Pontibacter kalidii TaxID=2592049 RepID=UPI0022548731|nr:hypothetical protein [Pontibacter kalidii]